MTLGHWLDIGRRVIAAPGGLAVARVLVRQVPFRVLLGLGLGRLSPLAIGAPLAGVFVLGAAAGAGAVLFFAPGSAQMRRTIRSRMRTVGDRIRHVEHETDEEMEVRKANERRRASAFATATRGEYAHHDDHDHDHEHEHDEHGQPRRRNNPRA